MKYLFFLGFVNLLCFVFMIPNTVLSIILGLTEKAIGREGILFYVGRVIRGFIFTSILLTLANYFIELGLSPFLIISIAYLGLMSEWVLETNSAKANYYNNIEFEYAVDRYKIVWWIYTLIFFVVYFAHIPVEPWLSGLTLKGVLWMAEIKALVWLIIVLGVGTLFMYIGQFSKIIGNRDKE